MKPLFKELKDIRIEKGVSLEDISNQTKIRIPFLEKIEEGDFSVVPEPFIRAFLREYAMEIELDPDRVIAKYEGKATTVRDEDFWKHNPDGPVVSESASGTESEPNLASSARKAGESDETGKTESVSAEPAAPKSDAVRAATRVISDDSPLPDAPVSTRGNLGEILDEKERKAPKIILGIVFVLIIIAAALGILYYNGSLPF